MIRVNNKNFILWFISILSLLLGTGWGMPLEDNHPPIGGTISNGTAGGEINETVPVSLYLYSDDSLVASYETATDNDGNFLFSDVNLLPGEFLIAQTIYQGVIYSSDSIVYDSGQEIPEIIIQVYDTTNRSDFIRIKHYHLFISRVEEQLRIGEYYLISNFGDLTWIGDENPDLGQITTLEFILPEDAQDLWFSGEGFDERYLETGNGFADTKPIPPGEEVLEVFFSYEIPFSDSLEFTRTNSYPIDKVEILVTETSGISITGDKIQSEGEIETETGTTLTFSAGSLQANEDLTIIVSKYTMLSRRTSSLEILAGVTVLVVAVLSAYWFWWRSGPTKLPEESKPLLEKLIQLDQEHKNGNLSLKSYQQQRDVIKEEIRNLQDKLKKS